MSGIVDIDCSGMDCFDMNYSDKDYSDKDYPDIGSDCSDWLHSDPDNFAVDYLIDTLVVPVVVADIRAGRSVTDSDLID